MEKRSRFRDHIDTEGVAANLCLYGTLLLVMFVGKACVETSRKVKQTLELPKFEVLEEPIDNRGDATYPNPSAFVAEGVSAE